MMEAKSISETSVKFYQTTWHNIPEDGHINTRRRENLKSHLSKNCSTILVSLRVYRSHVTHSWHMSYLSKNKLHWNQKTKNNVILSVENVHRVHRCMHSLFSSCLMQPGEELLCHGNGSPDEILSICLAQESREYVSLNSFWQVM
jgi:hypothetical protein